MNTNQNWDCECGWTGHEDDLESKCTFYATQEEPAEYEAWCPQCGADWERMTETEEEQDNVSEFKTAKEVLTAIDECLRKDVAGYIAELNRDAVVSTSHLRLRSLYASYGKAAVDAETDRQFKEQTS